MAGRAARHPGRQHRPDRPATSSAGPASCIVDAPSTQVRGDLVKVLGRNDNKLGPLQPTADLTECVATRP